MSATLAGWIVAIAAAYVGIGVLFAVPFVVRGVGRIDPAAREGTIGFRIIVFPGVVAFWPLLLRRWMSGSGRPPIERNAHRDAAGGSEVGRR